MRRRDTGGSGALVALVVADLAFSFQQTAIIPAIPSVQRDFHATQAWSAWLLTGYLVASSVATPLLGKLGDRRGRRRALIGALAAYLAASIGAALAPTIAVLIVFRSLQGVGGVVYPLTLSLARDELPPERLQFGIGMLTGAFGLGTTVGVAVSGVIVDALSWRYLFGVGAAVVAAALVAMVLAAAPEEQTRDGALDLPGTLLLAGGLSLLLIALTEGGPRGFGSPYVIGAFVASGALFAGWVAVDLRVADPLLDLHVLARPAVLLANLTSLAFGYVLFGVYFLVPYLVEANGSAGYGLAAGPVAAGLYLLPAALGETVSAPVAGMLGPRIAAKWVTGAGMAAITAAAGLLAAFHDRPWQIAAWSLLLGLGSGTALSVLSNLVTELIDHTETGAATSLNSTLRRAAGGIGAQVCALLLATLELRPHVPSNTAFTLAFAICAATGAAGTACALAIGRRRPA